MRLDNFTGNHTGYRQWTGTKTSGEEIFELYDGLKQSYLTDFDMLLSGYAPSAEAVEAVGKIGRDLRSKSVLKPGSFFWGRPRSADNSWSRACSLTVNSSPRPRHGRSRQALRQRGRRARVQRHPARARPDLTESIRSRVSTHPSPPPQSPIIPN